MSTRRKRAIRCSVCGETFARNEHLRRHERRHTGETPFTCPLCQRSFSRADSLRRHGVLHGDGDHPSPGSAATDTMISQNDTQNSVTHSMEGDGSFDAGAQRGQVDFDQGMPLQPQWLYDSGDTNATHINWMQPPPQTSLDLTGMEPFFSADFHLASLAPPSQSHDIPIAPLAQPTASNMPAESPATVRSEASSAPSELCGSTYVDSIMTRAAAGRDRHMPRNVSPVEGSAASAVPVYSLAACGDLYGEPLPRFITNELYHTTNQMFEQLCWANAGFFTPFSDQQFIPQHVYDHMVAAAVPFLETTMCFVDKALLESGRCSWILFLSLAAVGIRHGSSAPEHAVLSLDEFLRRALILVSETNASNPIDSTQLSQAMILHKICEVYGTSSGSLEQKVARLDGLKLSSAHGPALGTNSHTGHSRTLCAMWLLDAIISYQVLGSRGLVPDEISPQVPVEDTGLQTSRPLAFMLEDLYINKTVASGASEFARILIIHGLIIQTRDMVRRSESRLHTWEPLPNSPSARTQSELSPSQGHPTQSERLSKWQNATCDCLDILHWHANAQIGMAKGSEHPTVFFLHLARVVVLCPTDRLQQLAQLLTSPTPPSSQDVNSRLMELVCWVLQDTYKARLAVIHAGVLLYHVRRHSSDAFYESSGIFLSILCLWAYSYATTRQQALFPDPTALAQAPDILPPLIHLDRPTDDELVQLFVLHGDRIMPHVTGVGNLCAPGSPQKVLRVGVRMLGFTETWAVYKTYFRILSDLHDSMRDKD